MEPSNPMRAELDRARPALLQLLHNHSPTGGVTEALIALGDTYLRLNPDDAEVRAALDGLADLDGNA
jgi:hypothetical protein